MPLRLFLTLFALWSARAFAAADLVFLAPFHSGSVYIYDLASRARVATLPVEDAAGVVGIAVSSDGASLYLVDGDVRHRLRKFDTRSWRQAWEREFRDRLLSLGSAQVIHLTADNRWLLIKTYDIGAAASGIRVFDVENNRFAPAGLALDHCTRPLLSSAPDGSLAAVCPEWVEFLGAKAGETLAPQRESPVPLQKATTASLTSDGKTLYLLGTPKDAVPWQFVQIPSRDPGPASSQKLSDLLGTSVADADFQAPLLALDPAARDLVLVQSARGWELSANPLHVRRTLQFAGPVEAAQLSTDGRTLYTLRRDTARAVMLLGRTNIETGETSELVLHNELPFAPVVSGFAFAGKGAL